MNLANAASILGSSLTGHLSVLRTILTFLFGFLVGSGVIAVVLNFLFTKKLQKAQHEYDDKLRQQNIRNALGQVIVALNNFVSTWGSVRGKVRLNLRKDVPLVLSTGTNIKEAVRGIPTTLMDVDLSEVMNICNQLESIKERLESAKLSDPYGSGVLDFSKPDIDKLAERAEKCVEELERWRSEE